MASLRVLVRVRLDWSDPQHYEHGRPLSCRVCDTPTTMRDAQRRACHQSCAEVEIARELGAGEARIADEREVAR
ncbi:hypothetical protein [Salinispora fenicalii]|uniref:hypothetical protein n=1 Tax=Salinispora fenicalii TaxID=1137263 RepID=UPI000484602D|nr:hypothetical protein [Salinispora fenicalii]